MLVNPLIIPVGIFIGILVAAPVGPVNVLCIQRALSRGFVGGVSAGFGAVLGDGLVALLAALGVSYVVGLVEHYRFAFLVAGGLVLIAFGWRLYVTKPKFIPTGNGDHRHDIGAYAWDVAKTFFLTITNPGAVLGLFAIFGGIGSFVQLRGPVEALVMVGAVMVGSLVWWIGLSYLVSIFRHKFNLQRLQKVNQIAGIALALFGFVLFLEVGAELAGLI